MKLEDIKDILTSFEIADINRYRQELLAAAVAVAATLFFYHYIYSSNLAEAKKLDNQMNEIILETNRTLAEINETQKIAERLKEAMEKLKDMEERYNITQSKPY
jgi:vacuolar-type H+-ATPase subunit I/STV1